MPFEKPVGLRILVLMFVESTLKKVNLLFVGKVLGCRIQSPLSIRESLGVFVDGDDGGHQAEIGCLALSEPLKHLDAFIGTPREDRISA